MSAEPIAVAPLEWRMPVSTVLVESVDTIRLGLHLLLQHDRHHPHRVLASVASGAAGLEAVRDCRPDLLVCCVELPDMAFPAFLRRVKAAQPALTILATSEDPTDEEQYAALRLGAHGYIGKAESSADLRLAFALATDHMVRFTAKGRRLRHVAGGWAPMPEATDEPDYRPLSDRELQVLQGVACGMENKRIAAHLGISDQTIKNHITCILRKLHCGDRTEGAIYALKRNWIAYPGPGEEKPW